MARQEGARARRWRRQATARVLHVRGAPPSARATIPSAAGRLDDPDQRHRRRRPLRRRRRTPNPSRPPPARHTRQDRHRGRLRHQQLRRLHRPDDRRRRPAVGVKSCSVLAVQADGREVTTVEGLAGPDDTLHPVQQAFHEQHALQCGFCTPGMIMAAVDLLAREPRPQRHGDPRRARGQPVPVHRLPEHRPGRPRRRRRRCAPTATAEPAEPTPEAVEAATPDRGLPRRPCPTRPSRAGAVRRRP